MKTKKNYFILSVIFLITVYSCRTENDLSVDSPKETTIEANSTIANLVSRVALKDGSFDNMIDYASNLSVQLPMVVTVNGNELEITDSSGYETILDVFDLSDSDIDTSVISFPITVVLANYSTLVVNSNAELQALSSGENESDDDIECIDFEYPITISVFNETTELFDTISINSDYDMYSFIENLIEFTIATINFPITVKFSDDSTQTINTIQELQDAITTVIDTCDEDDDNDFNECNSNSYTISDIENALTDCSQWTVDKLKRSNNNLVNTYLDYLFTFNNDGTITVTENANTYSGTWEATGTVGNVNVTISIDSLPDFNNTWNLCKINLQAVEKQIELKLGTDRLRFGSECTN